MSNIKRAIAIDFDGCLCESAYPEIGAPHWRVIAQAFEEQQKGAGLILWTCREGKRLQEALDACKRWGLTFDAVNESLPEWLDAFGYNPRKIGASEYWDDRAVAITQDGPSGVWYDVSDKLPDPGERVIATTGSFSGEGYIGYQNGEAIWFREYGLPWEKAGLPKPCRWMKMPE